MIQLNKTLLGLTNMVDKIIKVFGAAAILLFAVSGCIFNIDDQNGFPDGSIEGYRPVYGTVAESSVSLTTPRAVKQPGKIYLYNQFLLVNEKGQGIHVFDNSNPVSPKAVYFITMLGNTDMAIKDDVLYADHSGELKAIRLNNFNTLTTLDSVKLQNWYLGVPPPAGFYFDCVDQQKGIVVRWEKVILNDPKCYASNWF